MVGYLKEDVPEADDLNPKVTQEMGEKTYLNVAHWSS
tara:strand:+ start:102341 stop:102451 length:111 start_codon:yes stop_codon:yes gene_type:complete